MTLESAVGKQHTDTSLWIGGP